MLKQLISPAGGSLKLWVGGAIEEVRVESGLKHNEFWRLLGVRHSTGHRWCRGINTPDLDALRAKMDTVGWDVVVTFKKRAG